MKVICIISGYIKSDDLPDSKDGMDLIEGKEYNVTNSFVDEGYCWYVLEEDTDSDAGYDSLRFEQVSQTDYAVKATLELVNK